MSESLDKAYETQLRNIEKSTGKTIAEWRQLIDASGLEKHGALVSMLKTNYGLGHGNANMLVHTCRQSHAAAQDNETDWVREQYEGKESLKKWYDVIMQKVMDFGGDVEVSPKKNYVSLRRKKQFAIIQPSTKSRLDVGLNLKSVETDGSIESAGSWNTMCTHRIKLEDGAAVDENLFSWLRKAYDGAG